MGSQNIGKYGMIMGITIKHNRETTLHLIPYTDSII